MQVSKVIKCKIVDLTNIKSQQLEQEYNNLQTLLQLESQELDFLPIYQNIPIYSANKQQALRFYKTINKREYPLSIRKDLIRIEKRDTKLASYWCRIPVKQRHGGIWLAIKPHQDFPDKFEFGESKLFRRKGEWWIYITIVREVEIKKSYSNILAIDLGSKVIATVCGSFDNKRPIFLGREVRGIRRHYQYLRAELGKRKLLRKIKQIGDKEKRIVNDLLHKVSKQIVELADKKDAYILLGDLKGLRNSAKGKMFRRIVSNMPYLKLTQYIEYKALEKGIKVLKTSERKTSKTCSKCGYEDKNNRRTQGLFRCKSCEFEINADVNGVRNILKFSEGYMLSERALSEQALNQSLRLEAPCMSEG